MKKCEKCGMIGRDDMTFCVNCGGNMVEASADPVVAKASATPIDGAANEVVSAPAEPGVVGATVNESVAKPKMNKNTVLLIGIIAAVLVGIGGIAFGIVMANSKSSGNNSQPSSTPTTVTRTEVVVGEWVFEIPEGIEYDVENDGLWLSDGDEWESFTSYRSDVDYSEVKADLDTYAEEIAKNINSKVYETGEDTFGDTDFLWVDFVDDDDEQYETYAFSKAGDTYTFLTSFNNADATINHDILDTISEVLSSARKRTSGREVVINSEIEDDEVDYEDDEIEYVGDDEDTEIEEFDD